MHGESAKGNEGFILMYNPKFVGKNEINVEVVDVCPTLATHLVGVDIPANSMGITRAYLGTNSTKENILALKRNLHQLRYSAQIKGKTQTQPQLSSNILIFTNQNNYRTFN